MIAVRRYAHHIYNWISVFGFSPLMTLKSIRGFPLYVADYMKLRRQEASAARRFDFAAPFLCLGDRFFEGGTARGHYFHQDLLVASRIFKHQPKVHLDVGSRVDGFVAHVAAFRHLKVLDIRPVSASIRNVSFVQGDLMAELDPALIGCCDSLSCLHALEHFGLGRYGDPVDYDGYLKGMRNLTKLVEPGGRFYFSTPIGPQRIEFNAHRVFDVGYLLQLLRDNFDILDFSYVDDKGDLHESAALSEEAVRANFGCHYGCGIFELRKRGVSP